MPSQTSLLTLRVSVEVLFGRFAFQTVPIHQG